MLYTILQGLPITYLVMRHELTKPTCRYRGTLAQAVAAAIATDNNVRATHSRWVPREGRELKGEREGYFFFLKGSWRVRGRGASCGRRSSMYIKTE